MQLPLSVSGWVFKEELSEDPEDVKKQESTEEDSTSPNTETSPVIKSEV